MDFVILHIEVEIQSWQNQTKIMVKDRSRSDVVRMRRICNQLKKSFAGQTEQTPINVCPVDLQPQLLPLYSLDEFEDDWHDNETMLDRAEALLHDVTSHKANVRVEAAQVLACWAKECPRCRVHIADALLKSGAQIAHVLQNSTLSLAEAYPLAATLHRISLCPDADNKLRNSCIAQELLAMRRLSNGCTLAIATAGGEIDSAYLKTFTEVPVL